MSLIENYISCHWHLDCFFKQWMQTNDEVNIKALHYWPLVGVIKGHSFEQRLHVMVSTASLAFLLFDA